MYQHGSFEISRDAKNRETYSQKHISMWSCAVLCLVVRRRIYGCCASVGKGLRLMHLLLFMPYLTVCCVGPGLYCVVLYNCLYVNTKSQFGWAAARLNLSVCLPNPPTMVSPIVCKSHPSTLYHVWNTSEEVSCRQSEGTRRLRHASIFGCITHFRRY